MTGHLVPPPGVHIVDVDDFCEDNHGLPLLDRIKREIPHFKVTLFTIVGRMSPDFVNGLIPRKSWIRMVPHGLFHITPREAENWDLEYCRYYLKMVKGWGWLEYGFKAPGWQISQPMYQALEEAGFWVADQAYNNHRRPPGLRAYLLDHPQKHHYHVQNVCGNGLEESLDQILALRDAFSFDWVENWTI